MDFKKDNKELYDKTNEHFNNKARKECLWERFASSRKLSKCARPGLSHKGHIMASSHNPSLDRPQKRVQYKFWIQDKYNFLKTHMRCKGPSKSSGFKSQARGASASAASAHISIAP